LVSRLSPPLSIASATIGVSLKLSLAKFPYPLNNCIAQERMIGKGHLEGGDGVLEAGELHARTSQRGVHGIDA
jgi:hypothetical protein